MDAIEPDDAFLYLLSAYLRKEGYKSRLCHLAGYPLPVINPEKGEYIMFGGPRLLDTDLPLFLHTCRAMDCDFVAAMKFTEHFGRDPVFRLDGDGAIHDVSDDVSCYADAYEVAGIYYFRECFSRAFRSCTPPLKVAFESCRDRKKVKGLPIGGKSLRYIGGELPVFGHRMPVLFLDRDGVIVEDSGYVHGTDLVFVERMFPVVAAANMAGEPVIVVTNQSGVARGYFPEEEVTLTNEYIRGYFSGRGLKIDAFYVCPYMTGGASPFYDKDSLCRKPQPGMILKACEDFDIDLSRSLMIGDKERDRIKLPYLTSVIFR